MKRFTDTNKWRDPWYRNLSSPAKQLWEYMRDNCDAIGLIDLDFKLASSDCGQPITPLHMVELGDRVEYVGGSKFFIPKFINFQCGNLTESCPAHKPVFRLIEVHGLISDGIVYHYPGHSLFTEDVAKKHPQYPTARQVVSHKNGKGKGQEGETEKKHEFYDEFGNELPESLRTTEFKSALSDWHAHKRQRGESYKPIGAKQLIANLAAIGPAAAVVVAIRYSIGQNYQGVHQERGQSKSQGGAKYPGVADGSGNL